MFIYLLPIVVVVVSNLLYHISQKSTPANLNPFLALLVTYTTATVITGVLYFTVKPARGMSSSLKDVKWTSFMLGIAIVGLEIGYLLAYRAGWNINICSLVTNTTVALLLIPVGFILYGERIEPVKVVGVILSITGLVILYFK